MRYFLLIYAVVMGQSVLAADDKPLIADPIVEKAVRERLNKPKGELIKNGIISHRGFLNFQGKNLNRRQALRNYRLR